MRRTVLLLSAVAVSTAALFAADPPAAKPTSAHVAQAEKMVAVTKEIGMALEAIKDEAGAKSAAAKLTALYGKLFAQVDEAEKLGKPSPADMKVIAKINRDGVALSQKVDAEETRLNNDPKIKKVLDEVKAAALEPSTGAK